MHIDTESNPCQHLHKEYCTTTTSVLTMHIVRTLRISTNIRSRSFVSPLSLAACVYMVPPCVSRNIVHVAWINKPRTHSVDDSSRAHQKALP